MIYNKRGASRRDQAPAETKRNDRQTATPSEQRHRMASTKEFLTKVELSDDEIIVWFNYSDKINPDDPDNDSRDFLLQEIYTITVTSRFIIASIKMR